MYEKDGIVYAGEIRPLIRVIFVKPLEDYKLYLLFSNGEYRIFDCEVLFKYKVYEPLKEKNVFDSVYVDHGIVSWLDGAIDIDPDWIYEDAVLVEEQQVFIP
jgi:hypothetical protein